jgi:hypothetical protein
MRRSGIFALTALVCTVGAAPSFAAWESLGSVSFSQADNYNSTPAHVRANRVALTARGADMFCDSVVAAFSNGRTQQIFRGDLSEDQSLTVALFGGQRNITNLDFDCHPRNGWRARVDVAANMPDNEGLFPYDTPFAR